MSAQAAFVVLGRQHEAAGVAVQAVHDAQAVVLALHAAQVAGAAVVDERVHQRAVLVVHRRVAHEPRLLRKHQQVLVLEAHVQVDGLPGERRARRRVLHLVHHRVPGGHHVLLRHRLAVHEHACPPPRHGRRRCGCAYRPRSARSASMRRPASLAETIWQSERAISRAAPARRARRCRRFRRPPRPRRTPPPARTPFPTWRRASSRPHRA